MGKRNLVRLKQITVERNNKDTKQNIENFKEIYVEMLYQYYKSTLK